MSTRPKLPGVVVDAIVAAGERFCGRGDPAQGMAQVMALLLLKQASDHWAERTAHCAQAHGGDEERIRRKLARERFVLPQAALRHEHHGELSAPCLADFDCLHAQRHETAIGGLIHQVLGHVAQANKALLADVFRGIQFDVDALADDAVAHHRRLRRLLEDLAPLDLRPSQVPPARAGEACRLLLARCTSRPRRGAAPRGLPRPTGQLLAGLAAPRPGDRICDPRCGDGSLLIEAAAQLAPHGGPSGVSFYGQEAHEPSWALARLLLLLHGHDATHIAWGDVLGSPALLQADRLMQFHVVLSAPAFGAGKQGDVSLEADRHGRFWRGLPPRSRGDYAVITHMIETALPRGGRVVVMVPCGVLSRGGAEGRIRRALIEENLLDAVIGVPASLRPGHASPAAVLVFDRAREKGGPRASCQDVLFIDPPHDAPAGAHCVDGSDPRVARLLQTFRARQSHAGLAHRASLQEIAGQGFNLSMSRYVSPVPATRPDAPESEAESALTQLEAELDRIRNQIRQSFKALDA
jgi:type I restriction enzyme M protein